MARKKIELIVDISNEKEFENALERFKDKLICAEIYCAFAGSCSALDRVLATLKIEWGSGDVALLRVLADQVEALSRLRDQSEPFYMFIVNKKVTTVFRGANGLKMMDVAQKELSYYRQEKEGIHVGRAKYEINEPTSAEMAWLNARAAERDLEQKNLLGRQTARQAVRKRHRAELMAAHLDDIDFVLYWPHATHAHPELYEHWNENNLIMVGREEMQLTQEQAVDILYMGDAPQNEASMHALLAGKALAICLRSLDRVNIVSLCRKILYEDNMAKRSDDAEEKSSVILPITAYEYYKTYSPTREQIMQKRRDEREKRIEEKREKRARCLSEMQRIARQAREEAIEAKRAAREQKKMELLKTGKLAELDQMKEEEELDNDEDIDIVIPEELSDESEEEDEVVDDPNEYFPPPGLPIPGFYCPPNDIAQANGLAILFPTLVQENVQPTEEFLPPHVLVMIHMHKRHKAIEHMIPFTYGIIHMGIFQASTPYDARHVAYSVKQFDAMDIDLHTLDEYKLCFMVSTKVDRPLLELMELNPLYVSRDTTDGEDECAAIFNVDYGDEYNEFEDFEQNRKSQEKNVDDS